MRRSLFLSFAIAAGLASAAVAQPSTVIVVRHAEKASQTESDPVLSDAGTQRAKDLAAALADAGVTSVITTQFQRTRLTAAPTIEALKTTTTVVPTTSGAAHVADVVAAIKSQPAGSTVLVVGHSNTVPAIIAALGGPKMPNMCDSKYSPMFILEMNGASPPRLIRTNYGAADPADPACAAMKAP